jgi:hypothetical protein
MAVASLSDPSLPAPSLQRLTTEAAASIADAGSRIEDVFAKVGGDLGQARDIFEQLNAGANLLAQELSGSNLASASNAFHDIAARLRGLAQTLPAETALLGTVAASVARASVLLRQLVKHINTIGIIARSSRIEAASLEGDRDDFMSFTHEAAELAKSVERSIAACSREQEQLAKAISTTLSGQTEFESRYLAQLLTVSAELISAYREIKAHQTLSMQLAESASAGTLRIGSAVGRAIISLQAGDSTRQRFEHVCSALNSAGAVGGGAGAIDGLASATPLICALQAAQLRDSVSEFEAHVAEICRALAALSTDSTRIIDHGHALLGGENGDMTPFLAVMKQRLAKASSLMAACGKANATVAASMSVSETMLGTFREATLALDDTVADITLIGMNASLKAARLGDRGRAFVVIANELNAAAARISAGASLLYPVLDTIEKAAADLKMLRLKQEALHIADLENSVIGALQDIEAGNAQLSRLMTGLTRESAEFESLLANAGGEMRGLGAKVTALSGIAGRLEAPGRSVGALSPEEARRLGERFDELYVRYTMAGEREVHLKQCDRLKLTCNAKAIELEKGGAASEDPIFF